MSRCLCLLTSLLAFTGMTPPNSEVVADSAAKGSEQQMSSEDQCSCALELKVQQLSVYASQRRLCITAAVATAFQEVEEGLLLLAQPKAKSIAAEIAPAPKVFCCRCLSRDSKSSTID